VLVAGALGATQRVQLMDAALAGCDLLERAVAGEDVGEYQDGVRWIHQHESGRLELERAHVREGGRIQLEQTAPGEQRLGIPQEVAVGVANMVVGALSQPQPIRNPRLALLVAALVRTRLLGFTCVLAGLSPATGGAQATAQQIALVNRAERIAAGDEPSALRITVKVRSALHAVAQASMDRDVPPS
jgi:hypothetical protein